MISLTIALFLAATLLADVVFFAAVMLGAMKGMPRKPRNTP